MQNSPSEVFPERLAFVSEDELAVNYAAALVDWQKHAISEFPNEACGFILKDGAFFPCKNISPEPRNNFIVDEDEEVYERGIVAFLHSHTPGEPDERGIVQPVAPYPSKADMQSQMDCAYPWGISVCDGEVVTAPLWFGDQVKKRPLIGRVFVHGIWDCYSLVRDWHMEEHGIILPDYARDYLWWGTDEEPGEDMYEKYFKEAGFNRVYRDNGPLVGDCFICRIKSPVLNHAGVYIGDSHLLHHVTGYLSMRSPVSRWHSKLDFLVRHKDLPEPT